MRTAQIDRKTKETDISLFLDLDGKGESMIDTGVGFLNHMLTLFAKHGRFYLEVICHGDTDVDDHHSVEDIGIALAFSGVSARADLSSFNAESFKTGQNFVERNVSEKVSKNTEFHINFSSFFQFSKNTILPVFEDS